MCIRDRFTPSEVENLEADYVIDEIYKKAEAIYENREKVFGSPLMRELERVVLLKNVDTKWMDHIDAMEELKRGIRLRAYAQHDPVVEYRLEGFDMFDEMIAAIREDTARMMLTLRLQVQRAPAREPDVYKRQILSSATKRASPCWWAPFPLKNLSC